MKLSRTSAKLRSNKKCHAFQRQMVLEHKARAWNICCLTSGLIQILPLSLPCSNKICHTLRNQIVLEHKARALESAVSLQACSELALSLLLSSPSQTLVSHFVQHRSGSQFEMLSFSMQSQSWVSWMAGSHPRAHGP